jgi:multiple antibiotic resistance protein
MSQTDILTALSAFFAIMNPFVILPVFLSLTEEMSVAQQRIIASKVFASSLLMALVILIAGNLILNFFDITVDQFRIAAGLVLGHIAWNLLNGEHAQSHQGSDQEQKEMSLGALAFYPITFPLVVGPGTIATLVIFSGQHDTPQALAILAGLVVAVLLALFVVLFFAAFIGLGLSALMRVIMTRLMGMILLTIAIAIGATGLLGVFPGLAG